MAHHHHRQQSSSELLAGVPTSSSGELPAAAAAATGQKRSNKKRLLIILATSFLLLAAVGLVAGVTASSRRRRGNNDDEDTTPSHAILRRACSSTLYPDLCYTSIADHPSLVATISDHNDVIHSSLNLTELSVEHAYFKVEKLRAGAAKRKLSERELTALHDCLEMIDETLDELRKADDDLRTYSTAATGGGGGESQSLLRHANDIKTLLSAAMTNQESCLDGFSHDKFDRSLRNALLDSLTHISHMCSNALAMFNNLTAAASGKRHRKLLEVDEEGFPVWMPESDRRLLQGGAAVTPDVVVAADGSGNFRTIQAAVAAAPEKSSKRYVIRIKAGTYKENVDVPKKKTNIMFLGDGRQSTIITGSRNVVDGSTTFHSATVAAVGERFLARDLTIQNTAGPSKHQAVALRVGSDLSAFYQCNIEAYQDTLYVHSLRQFYRDCYIAGTVDFIFGNAAAVLQNCNIQARRPNAGQKNMVTAQGREDPNQNTGISIHSCTISASSDLSAVKSSFPTYLGRPWKAYSRTVIMKSSISDVIHPAGWHEWNGNFALDTLVYREYQNTGAGAGTAGRVKWKGYKVVTDPAEVQPYTPANFISGSSWLGSTGIPFSLGL